MPTITRSRRSTRLSSPRGSYTDRRSPWEFTPHYSTPSCSNVGREPLKRNGPTRPGSKWQGGSRQARAALIRR